MDFYSGQRSYQQFDENLEEEKRKIEMKTGCVGWGEMCGLAQGRSQEVEDPPKPGNLLQKNGVISEGSIFTNKFSKIKI